jgi:hypothetical protein
MLIIYIEKKANSGESPVISADTDYTVCGDPILSSAMIQPYSLSI